MLQNLITLKKGINKIVIEQDDLGVLNQRYRIARIPTGLSLLNLRADVDQPFIGSALPSSSGPTTHQSNVNEYSMSYRFEIGTNEDPDYYMDEINPTVSGVYGANSGTYFSSPAVAERPINIHLKSNVIPRTWSFGGDISVARYGVAGCGTQTAGLITGGYTGIVSVVTDEYDGTSWSASNNLNTARNEFPGCGTQTAGLCFGGNGPSAVTEEYDGTSWTASNNLNVAVRYPAGFGIQTSAVSAGGHDGAKTDAAEEYDGTSWTVVNSLNVSRIQVTGCGRSTAGLCLGGHDGGSLAVDTCEEYDGYTWSILNSLIQARNTGTSFGTVSNAVITGGTVSSGYANTTEEYDDSTWITSSPINESKGYSASSGSASAGLIASGWNAGYFSTSEEYSEIDISTITITGKMVLNFTLI